MTKAGRKQLNRNFVWARIGKIHLTHLKRAVRRLRDRCFHFPRQVVVSSGLDAALAGYRVSMHQFAELATAALKSVACVIFAVLACA
jgi:hypothetical protein